MAVDLRGRAAFREGRRAALLGPAVGCSSRAALRLPALAAAVVAGAGPVPVAAGSVAAAFREVVAAVVSAAVQVDAEVPADPGNGDEEVPRAAKRFLGIVPAADSRDFAAH